ncbi:SAM-dependent methyltransferase, MidA [hydrothermal vent metagenome]|uniref:SAM-dependent methyltransferase, MidA n=1 Tax=hydrothermal vent metagenome TaxID=652676 RepID=A0A3B1AX61_9ZZZZ
MSQQKNDFPAHPRASQKSLSSLPIPSTDAQHLSMKLSATIAGAIAAAGGSLPFWRYMEIALHEPGLGYYSAGSHKFGAEGDFITAPEISPLFSQTLAQAIQPVLSNIENSQILEVGAGSGVMAADILLQLAANKSLPEKYNILETSAELRQRQQQTIHERIPELAARVHWCDHFPDNFNGVILANELLDALPAHRFVIDSNHTRELCVALDGDRFIWQPGNTDNPRLMQRVQQIEAQTGQPFSNGYVSEILFAAEDWVSNAAKHLNTGLILLLDYGQPRSIYYHPQRNQGSLSCHYRHRMHDDPFCYPGLQDITAHVDFTAIADAALDAGLDINGYTTQAHFLLGSGITHGLDAETDPARQLEYSSQIKKLTLPQEMGETFKVMGLTKNCDVMLAGFMLQDMRDRL